MCAYVCACARHVCVVYSSVRTSVCIHVSVCTSYMHVHNYSPCHAHSAKSRVHCDLLQVHSLDTAVPDMVCGVQCGSFLELSVPRL